MSRTSHLSRLLAGLGVGAAATSTGVASAEAPAPADAPVDVVIHDTAPPQRWLSLEFNPLPLIIGKVSVNVVIVPVDHHALVLSPFYVTTTTEPIYADNGESLQLPQQKFSGFGGEIGYRYYTGLGGPRGFFAGPSLILGAMGAKAQNGSTTDYLDWGVAADVGYEMLVVDSLAIAVGAGVQYTTPSTTIPNQQFPADVYSNSKVLPRALASIGWAF
jgi:hypothetical protein